MSISTSAKVWAIIGGAAALVIVPAGVTFAVVAAHDEFRPGIAQRASSGAAQQDPSWTVRGGMMNGSADRAGDRVQARDGSNCDGNGPVGTPPSANVRGNGPANWQGNGPGMMNGSGPRTN
jgi:hypothetical protein